MDDRYPEPDWAMEKEWHWESWKFGMSMDELFTSLHNRFNTWSAPLQSPEAFHHDVWEISNAASTKEELFQALEIRKRQRSEEMAQAWNSIAVHLVGGKSMFTGDHWAYAVRFFRTRSLDHMLAFLYQFLNEEEKEKVKLTTKEHGKRSDNRGKKKNKKDEPLAGFNVDVNTPTSSTTPRPLEGDRDQPSPIHSDSNYPSHHHGKQEYNTDHNMIMPLPSANNKDDDVLALLTPTPSSPTPLVKEMYPPLMTTSSSCSSSSNKDFTSHNPNHMQAQVDRHTSLRSYPCPSISHSPSSSPLSPPPPSFSASPLVDTKIVNTNFVSGPRKRELRQELQLQKQKQKLQLSHNNNSNKNRITKRARRMMTRGKLKAIKPRPKLVIVTPTGKNGLSLTTTTTGDTATVTTSGTITK
ncbi:hypothetical protein FHL15_004223 [Xylaria flabelliformis]|uniref:Uncharacterized protein n=1 Tax=Xylaria flabelliformis TaxID=2512241 RepID=A0A553I3J3_9PEZI|nr:hypothetical protein FHL15_004223 [Xylaria flabelliformis]